MSILEKFVYTAISEFVLQHVFTAKSVFLMQNKYVFTVKCGVFMQ